MTTEGQPDNPGVIAWPPLLYLGFLLAGLAIDYLWPAPFIAAEWLQYAFGTALICLGAVLMGLGVYWFGHAGTNIPPHLPATALVTTGIYRFTRNPMYLGATLIYLGIAIAVDSFWIVLLVVPLLLTMHFGVIVREERYLERKFGAAYVDYRGTVRRWL